MITAKMIGVAAVALGPRDFASRASDTLIESLLK